MIEVNRVYRPEINAAEPYGVEVLWDVSYDDTSAGSSEMGWYKTEAEQIAAYKQALAENGIHDSTKFYISNATGSVYFMEGNTIMHSPIHRGNTFCLDDFGAVDEELVADEHVYPPETENFTQLKDIYAHVRKVLK